MNKINTEINGKIEGFSFYNEHVTLITDNDLSMEQFENIAMLAEQATEHEELVIVAESVRDEYFLENQNEMFWAFNTSYIMNNLKSDIINDLSDYEYNQLEKSLQDIQGKLCEGANTIVKALLENPKDFLLEAASEDGYGHFLSSYDGCEYDIEMEGVTYYVYKN